MREGLRKCAVVMSCPSLDCAADNLNEVVQRFCARENVRNAAAEYGLKGEWEGLSTA